MHRSPQDVERGTAAHYDLKRHPLVQVTKTFRAPVEDLYRAWTSAELAKQWWGPHNYTAPVVKLDVRVGGKSLLAMKGPNGKIMYSGGVYKELIPNERIVTTDYFADENGDRISPDDIGMPGDWADVCTVTVRFERISAETSRMSLTHEGIPKAMHDDCVQGWSESLEKLQRLVEKT